MSQILKKENSLLSPKLDVVFQALFGEVRSEEITSKFLEAILNQKIHTIDLSKNLVLRRDYPKDKLGVLAIIAKINDGEYCNIEMQVSEQEEIIERLLYYWGRVYTKQLKSGQTYDVLKKTIVILIANFNVKGLETLSQDEKMQRLAELREKAIFELNTAVSSGFRQGMKRGIEEGIEKGIKQGTLKEKREIATKLLKSGFDINLIQEITNLSTKEIEDLKENKD